jgi:RecA/RadA recombinase
MVKKKDEFTFDDINKELSQINPLGSVMEHSEFSEVTEWIDTGNYALNAALSGSLFGGWPNNRSSAICGPSGTGKTYLALNSVRTAQEMGYNIIFYDSEAAVDRPLMKKFGIDTERVNYQPVNTVQDFRTSITTLTNRMQDAKQSGVKLPKMMVVLDSAGNLATQKEIDDAISGSEKSDMTRAKLLKSTFRIIQTPLAHLKIPFLFTNHTYQTQDFISQQVAGGGCLVPGSLVLLADGTLKKIEDIKKGDCVETLMGGKEIEEIWTFDKKTYEVEFENGEVVKCSDRHRFYIGNEDDDPLDDKNWVYAKDLVEGDEVSIYT